MRNNPAECLGWIAMGRKKPRRPEWEKHISLPGSETRSMCGEIFMFGAFMFIDDDHARRTVEHGSNLTVCPECDLLRLATYGPPPTRIPVVAPSDYHDRLADAERNQHDPRY